MYIYNIQIYNIDFHICTFLYPFHSSNISNRNAEAWRVLAAQQRSGEQKGGVGGGDHGPKSPGWPGDFSIFFGRFERCFFVLDFFFWFAFGGLSMIRLKCISVLQTQVWKQSNSWTPKSPKNWMKLGDVFLSFSRGWLDLSLPAFSRGAAPFRSFQFFFGGEMWWGLQMEVCQKPKGVP